MPETPTDYTMPNAGPWDGPDRIRVIQLDGGCHFARRGGKAIDKHGGWYRLAQANSSNLAGFLATEQFPNPFDTVAATHAASGLRVTTTGDFAPANFGKDKSFVFPCSNRGLVEGDLGHDFDIIVPGIVVGTPVQCVNPNSSTYGVLRAVEIVDDGGNWGAFKVAEGHRYGDQ